MIPFDFAPFVCLKRLFQNRQTTRFFHRGYFALKQAYSQNDRFQALAYVIERNQCVQVEIVVQVRSKTVLAVEDLFQI